jgi:hypothetical protein
MAMSAASIAHLLGATRQGRNWRAPCPCGCGYDLSFCDSADGQRLLVHCYGGCDFPTVLGELVQYGLLDDTDLCAPPSGRATFDHNDHERRRNKIQQACAIYTSGVWDERIRIYLRSRWIERISPILKFLEQAPHRLGARLPAMLAPVVDIDGEQIGAHLTYLRRDSCGKAELPKEYQRECRGALAGGAIRLFPFDPEVELLLCEGLETALAAAEIFSLPSWSAVYAGGLRSLALPAEIRRLVIAADNDARAPGGATP